MDENKNAPCGEIEGSEIERDFSSGTGAGALKAARFSDEASPRPTAGSGRPRPVPGAPLPPPPPRRLSGWPLACLILGLALIGACNWTFGSLFQGLGSIGAPLTAAEPSVGVLVVEGEIAGSIWATNVLCNFENDPNIRSVVLRIDSPGGAVAPCQEIYQALREFGKPVVVSMGSVAASGGLYIAAAGHHIFANPGTITGSIGVIMSTVELDEAMEKLGVRMRTIASGPYKDIGSYARPMRPDEAKLLEDMVLLVYEQFVADLAAGRPGLSPDKVREMADGRIFSGQEALGLGLVDQLGGFEEAVALAASLGGLDPERRPPLLYEDGRRSWWQEALKGNLTLFGLLDGTDPLPGRISLKYIYQPGM